MEDFDVPLDSSSGSSGSHVNSKVQQLCAKNAQLKTDLVATKALLDKAMAITPELESVHARNRKLIAELSEANQRCENLQSRLRDSQLRCLDQDAKDREREGTIKRLDKTNEDLTNKFREAQKENEDLKRICTEAKEREDREQKELKSFFEHISQLSGVTVSNLENVTGVVASLKAKITDKKEESCAQCQEKQNIIDALATNIKKKKKQVKAAEEELYRKDELLRDAEQRIQAVLHEKKVTEYDTNLKLLEKFKEANTGLQAQVRKLKHEKKALKKENIVKDQQLQALKDRPPPLPTVTGSSDEKVLKVQIEGLEIQKARMESCVREKEATIQELQMMTGKLKSKLKNLRREKDIECISEINKLKSEKKQHLAQITELQLKISDYSEQIKAIETQIEMAQSSQITRKATMDSMGKEMSKMKKAQDLVSKQASRQKKEIEDLHQERQKLITLIHRHNHIIGLVTAFADSKDEQLRKAQEREKTLQSIKPVVLDVDLTPVTLIKNSLVPRLDGELKRTVQKILSGDGSEKDKVERVYDAITESFTTMDNEIKARDAEIRTLHDKKCENCRTLQTIMRRVICNFQATQHIDGEEITAEMIRSTIKMMEEVIKSVDSETPIHSECNAYDTMAASQVMVNAELSAKAKAMAREIEAYKKDWESLQALLNCSNGDVVSALQRLIVRYRKMKEVNKCLNKELFSIPIEGAHTVREMVENQKEEIARLSSELEERIRSLGDAEKWNLDLKNEVESLQKVQSEQTAQYEKALESRNRACVELSTKINQLEGQNEALTLKISQNEEEYAKSAAAQKQKYEQQTARLMQELARVKKSASDRMERQQRRFATRISKMKHRIQDTKKECEAMNDTAKREIEELQRTCGTLNANLKESEDRNAKLAKKLSKAKRNMATLATAIDREREQTERDKKVVEVQHACQMMQIESKHHEEVIAVKNTGESKAEELKIKVLSAFNLLDSFEQREIDDETFDLTLRRLARTVATLKKE